MQDIVVNIFKIIDKWLNSIGKRLFMTCLLFIRGIV